MTCSGFLCLFRTLEYIGDKAKILPPHIQFSTFQAPKIFFCKLKQFRAFFYVTDHVKVLNQKCICPKKFFCTERGSKIIVLPKEMLVLFSFGTFLTNYDGRWNNYMFNLSLAFSDSNNFMRFHPPPPSSLGTMVQCWRFTVFVIWPKACILQVHLRTVHKLCNAFRRGRGLSLELCRAIRFGAKDSHPVRTQVRIPLKACVFIGYHNEPAIYIDGSCAVCRISLL